MVPFLSVITDDCIRNGRDYNAGGARYNNSFIQAVGLGSITDSLAAFKTYPVYGVLAVGGLVISALFMPMSGRHGGVEVTWYLSPATFPLLVGALIMVALVLVYSQIVGTFTLPYMFVFRPQLLMLEPGGGTAAPLDIAVVVITAAVGILAFAAAIAGYLMGASEGAVAAILACLAIEAAGIALGVPARGLVATGGSAPALVSFESACRSTAIRRSSRSTIWSTRAPSARSSSPSSEAHS